MNAISSPAPAAHGKPAQELVFADTPQIRQELSLVDPVSIEPGTTIDPKLVQQADDQVARLLSIDLNDHNTIEKVKGSVESMGLALQKDAARRSAMLKQPITSLLKAGEDGGPVANSLIDLKIQVEDLDPSKLNLSSGWFSRLLGYLPGIGTPLKRYFTRYEAAETVIDAIMNSLKSGAEQLKRDNITLAEDQKAMRVLTLKLEQMIKFGQLIDQRLQDQLDNNILADDPRHRFVSEELLFPLRQRIQDLQQQLLVNQQGFLTMEMIIRNNKELIRGVNRAMNVTVAALQVAVTLALALANQRIVLKKIQAITTTTEKLIADSASRLRTQGAEIHKQASGAMLDLGVLRAAFADIRGALDDISRYRQEALPRMAQNIVEMDRLANESEEQIRKVEQAEKAAQDFSIEYTS